MNYTFPFTPHRFQYETKEEAITKNPVLLKHRVGLGKTAMSLLIALHHAEYNDVDQIVIVCPPILMDQWYEFVTSIPEIPSVVLYRGTPSERKAKNIEDAAVIIVSTNVFRGKTDYPRFLKMSKQNKWALIWDELSLKSLKTKTIRKVKEIVYRRLRVKLEHDPYHYLIALNATPLSDLGQIYNWSTVFVPGTWVSLRLFQEVHAGPEDKWGKVLEWLHTDVLEKVYNRFTVDSPNANIELPEISYNVVPYHLSSAHSELYELVQRSKFDSLPDDITELAVRSMFSALQRLVLSPYDAGLNEEPAFYAWLDSYVNQIGDEQVVVFTRHVAVSREIIKTLGADRAVGIYGEITGNKRKESFQRIKSGDAQFLVANIDSAGVGLNLQFIHRAVLAELPFRQDKMQQIIGRIHRQGQKEKTFVDIPLAIGTVQETIYYNLLKNSKDLHLIYKDKTALLDLLVKYSLTGKL